MKFSTIAVVASFLCGNNAVQAFAPPQQYGRAAPTRLFDADMPAPAAETSVEMPVIQSRGGAPVDVRYSDFLKLVNGDRKLPGLCPPRHPANFHELHLRDEEG